MVFKVNETTKSYRACGLTNSSLVVRNGRDPSKFDMVKLKRWLECRGALMSGRKRSCKLDISILEGKFMVTLRVVVQ